MALFFLGIDPGQKGAIALLHENGRMVDLRSTPKTKEQVPDLVYALKEITGGGDIIVGLEDVRARGGYGDAKAVGARQIGGLMEWKGVWEGTLKTHQLTFYLISPQKWQTIVDGPKIRKGSPSAERKRWVASFASRVWPYHDFFTKQDNAKEGFADAACLAEYTRRMHLGKLGGVK